MLTETTRCVEIASITSLGAFGNGARSFNNGSRVALVGRKSGSVDLKMSYENYFNDKRSVGGPYVRNHYNNRNSSVNNNQTNNGSRSPRGSNYNKGSFGRMLGSPRGSFVNHFSYNGSLGERQGQ